MTATQLAEQIGMTQANVSTLRTGKAKAIRFTTLLAICEALNCVPGDLLSVGRAESDVDKGQTRIGGVDVVLIDPGEEPIAVIKVLRELDDIGLRASLELVEAAPCVVLSGLCRPDAEAAMVKLRASGATVELV